MSRVTVALGVGFFAQLELLDLGNVTELAGECSRRIRIGDLNARRNW